MELLNVGAVSILDYHLGDARFVEYLEGIVQDGAEVYCRYIPQQGETIQSVADILVGLQNGAPWVTGWLPYNEPNLEWTSVAPTDINANLGYFYTLYLLNKGDPRKLWYPPLAQDMGGDRDHRVIYDALRTSVETWIEAGAGFAWHSYWDSNELDYLVEQDFPQWLQDLMPWDRTLIHEAGRKPDREPKGTEGLVEEMGFRFGIGSPGQAWQSRAHAITPWLLSSEDPAFEDQAWISHEGVRRDVLYQYAGWGPGWEEYP